MLAGRFLVAGAILYAWSIRQGDRKGDRPGLREWRSAAIVSAALLLIGNGGVAWAEQRVATGVASLIIATTPLWMALFDRVAYGQRLSRTTVLGLGVGLAGAALLANPFGHGHVDAFGALWLACAAMSWAAGSLYSRRAALPRRPLVGASMEMIVGGAMLGLLAVATGGPGHVHHVSTESLLALAYLIGLGSLVGFTADVWLLRNAPTSLVSTYAYVNPGVAVFLGWMIENETIGPRVLLAGGMIVAAVALIVSARPRPRAEVPAGAAAPVRARYPDWIFRRRPRQSAPRGWIGS